MNTMRRIVKAGRAAIKVAVRTFEGAGGSGRWSPSAFMPAQNSQSLAARAIIAKRSTYLTHNSPTGAAFVEAWVTALVGDGPVFKSAHPDPDKRKDIEARFYDWCGRCDIEGVNDLSGLLMVAVRSAVQSGEAIMHMPVDHYGNLSLRLLASEQLDSSKTIPSLGMTGDAPRIVAGVEMDAEGRRVAYWILPDAPDSPWASIAPSQRVDAVDIAHVFVRRFAGQQRGLPWMTPVATRLVELDQLEDSALMKARVSAIFAGFVTDPDGSSGLFDNVNGTNPPTLGELEPGTIQALPQGTDVKFTPIADMSTVTDLLRHLLRSVAAGGGLTYEILTGDLSQVNFSSARLGEANFRRRVKALQSSMLVAQLLTPIFRRWMLIEILTGRLHAPDFYRSPLDYLGVTVLWPGSAPIDPLKQSKADALDLASRTRSRAEIIASNGRDVSDVDSEIEDDPLFVADPVAAAALLAQPEDPQNAN